ncbi:MAG: hypothetical protein NT069_12345 [Planctomycetota bacterium]|nr:hypothetical protein [Planctomycetota bacterium]
MNCTEFDRLWQRRFDGEGSLVSLAEEAHLEGCERCQAHYEAGLMLEESLGAWRSERPQVDLARQIVRALRDDRPIPRTVAATQSTNETSAPSIAIASRVLPAPGRSERRERLLRLAFALVGGLATLTGVWVFVGALTAPPAPAPIVTMERPAPRERTHKTPDVRTRSDSDRDQEMVRRTRQAYEPMARKAAGAIDQMAMMVVPGWARIGQAPETVPAKPTNRVDDSKPSDEPHLLQQLEREIRPIGKGVGEALDFLWIAGDSHNAASPETPDDFK